MRFEQVQTDSFSEKKILWWGACITCGTNITGIYDIDRHKRLFSMLDKQWKEYDIFSHYIFGGIGALPSLGTFSSQRRRRRWTKETESRTALFVKEVWEEN